MWGLSLSQSSSLTYTIGGVFVIVYNSGLDHHGSQLLLSRQNCSMWFHCDALHNVIFLFFHLPYWSIAPIIVDVLHGFTALLFLEYSSCFETNKLTCLLGNGFFLNPSNSCYIFLLYLNFKNIIVRLITCFLCSYHACQIFSILDTIYHSINKIIFYA